MKKHEYQRFFSGNSEDSKKLLKHSSAFGVSGTDLSKLAKNVAIIAIIADHEKYPDYDVESEDEINELLKKISVIFALTPNLTKNLDEMLIIDGLVQLLEKRDLELRLTRKALEANNAKLVEIEKKLAAMCEHATEVEEQLYEEQAHKDV